MGYDGARRSEPSLSAKEPAWSSWTFSTSLGLDAAGCDFVGDETVESDHDVAWWPVVVRDHQKRKIADLTLNAVKALQRFLRAEGINESDGKIRREPGSKRETINEGTPEEETVTLYMLTWRRGR